MIKFSKSAYKHSLIPRNLIRSSKFKLYLIISPTQRMVVISLRYSLTTIFLSLRLAKLNRDKKLIESIVMHLKGMSWGLIKPQRTE